MEDVVTQVYTQEGKAKGKVTLPGKLFALPWNADLVHQVVTGMQSNARRGTAHTKDRSEVRGGGKKPWQQKGTGRARHGSSRSPIWIGGGVTHGPRAEKNYDKKINVKAKAKALFHVLSSKLRDQEILFIDSLTLPETKTKGALSVLKTLSSIEGFSNIDGVKRKSVLFVIPEASSSVVRSFRNLPNISVQTLDRVSVLELLGHRYVVVSSPDVSLAAWNKKGEYLSKKAPEPKKQARAKSTK